MIDDGPRSPRAARDLRWMRGSTVATLATIVATGAVVQLLVGIDSATPRIAALAALTVAAAAAALAVVPALTRPRGASGVRLTIPVALAVLGVATWLLGLVPPFAGWAWGFTLAIAGGMLACLLPAWWPVAALAATYLLLGVGGATATATAVAGSARGSGPPGTTGSSADYVLVGTLAVFALMPLSAVWVLRVVLRLDDARRLASDLAIARERLRFATDLHDIQGHHLQVIALKSELAERLLPDERERAAAELGEIRAIARAALEDTRAVVNDYRTVTVAVEARNAAAVLRSAGVRCEARIDAADLSAEVGALFAVAIREGATNILRHSAATEATIELGPDGEGGHRLTVSNDGARARRAGGTGLLGLADRVASRDGTVETARHDGRFVLTVRLPRTARLQPEASR